MKNFNSNAWVFYGILFAGIIGGSVFVFDTVYAEDVKIETIKGINFDETRTYITDDSYRAVWSSAPNRFIDYNDGEGNPVYVDFKEREDAVNIYFESASGSVIFNKNTCTMSTYDGGKLLGQPLQTTQSHTIKEALNGTDTWNVMNINNESCDVNYTVNEKGIQIVSSKGNFDIIYDVEYSSGFEWTYEYTNNDNTKTDHKYGFTFVCDGIECDDVKLNDVKLEEGETKFKEELKGKQIKLGKRQLDLKEKEHGFTWAMKKTQKDKMNIDFTHSKGRLNVGDKLIVDPTFTDSTPTTDGTIVDNNNSDDCDFFGTYQYNTHWNVYIYPDSSGADCYFSFAEWDISSIPAGVDIDLVEFDYEQTYSYAITKNCDYVSLENVRPSGSADAMGQQMMTGPAMLTNDSTCTTVGINKSVDFGSVGVDEVQARLDASDGYFGMGVLLSDLSSHATSVIGQEINDSSAVSTPDPTLTIEYTAGVESPGPALSPVTIGLPGMINFTFTTNNATGVAGYAIFNSTDDVTYQSLFNTANFTGDTGFYLHTGLSPNEPNYYKTSAFSLNNGTETTPILGTSDDYPDAPSITATADSETQITVSYVAGASDGRDLVKDYTLQASINSGPWLDLVTNSTHTDPYVHSGLSGGDSVSYGWRDGNGVGWSQSGNVTGGTFSDIVATLTISNGNVGDVIKADSTLNVQNSSPLPVSITLQEWIRNGTTVQTATPSDTWVIESKSIDSMWFPITNDLFYQYTMNVTLTNGVDTTEIQSNILNITRIYAPDYQPGIDTPAQLVNYTLIRNTNDFDLNFNRDIGGTWQAECKYANLGEALAGEGTWDNQTDIGYYTNNESTGNDETVYIACYNDDLLFTITSYSNSTNSLVLGLSIFDNLGGLFGAPAVLLIILAVATMATGRNAPTMLIVLLTVIGIVGALGMLVLEAEVWGILVVAGAIGIFQVRRLF